MILRSLLTLSSTTTTTTTTTTTVTRWASSSSLSARARSPAPAQRPRGLLALLPPPPSLSSASASAPLLLPRRSLLSTTTTTTTTTTTRKTTSPPPRDTVTATATTTATATATATAAATAAAAATALPSLAGDVSAVPPPPAGAGPLERYEHYVAAGVITDDAHQREALVHLQRLFEQLRTHRPPVPAAYVETTHVDDAIPLRSVSADNFSLNPLKVFSALFAAKSKPTALGFAGKAHALAAQERDVSAPHYDAALAASTPRGLYLHGDVGCGKSFLMDMFFACFPDVERKRRIHFHAFMIDVHKRVHRWRMQKRAGDLSPIPPLANELAGSAWLLCFDEFQVTDIADASILKQLFTELWKYGVVVVATSNRVPDDLYKGGLNRQHFVPFIDVLYAHNHVHRIGSGVDYRLTGEKTKQVYHVNDAEGRGEMAFEEQWVKLVGADDLRTVLPHSIELDTGRAVSVPRASLQRRIARFTFDELCRRPLGAADYGAICAEFHTVFVEDVPAMNLSSRIEARRFIVFIDEVYEHRVKLIVLAERPPEQLFTGGRKDDGERDARDATHEERMFVDDLKLDFAGDEVATLFTGEEETFMFNRAVSRLNELQTVQYLQQQHIAGDH